MIVPYAAGGPTDTVARLINEPMTRSLGQQVVVENVGGASGTIGAARVAKADPDGYTLMLHAPPRPRTTCSTASCLMAPTPRSRRSGRHRDAHDPGGQGRPTAELSRRVLDYIRTNKNKVTYGNAGLGGPSHLCGMLLMSMLDTPMTLVPYKGTGPALTDLLGGHIDLICDQATNTISHIKSGKLKAYAVASQSRVAALPDLPTLDEAGLKGFETTVWLGMYAPKDTPKAVVDKVVTALHAALQDPKVVERLADLVNRSPRPGDS